MQIGSFRYVEVVKNNGKEMYQKMCCTCEVGFISLLTPINVFFLLFAYLVAVTGYHYTVLIIFLLLGYNFEYINDSCASSPG